MFEQSSIHVLSHLASTSVTELPRLLEGLSIDDLSAGALVEYMAAAQQVIRHFEGLQLQAMGAYAWSCATPTDEQGRPARSPKAERAKHYGADDTDELGEFAAHEIAGALTLAPRTAGIRLGVAQDMAERLQDTRAAVVSGRLDAYKATLITRKTRVLSTLGARIVEAQILATAPRLTYGKLASELDRLVIAADPRGANERHEKARADRRCWTQPSDDGMGRFAADMSAEDLRTVWGALDAKAWATKELSAQNRKTLDQLRVDALVQLCTDSLDRSHQGKYVVPNNRSITEAALSRLASVIRRRTVISCHVSAEVLTGDADDPVYLAGHGWVPAPVGRRLLSANALVRRILDDPVTGTPVEVSRKTYRPDPQVAEMVRERDRTCTFATCNAPASHGQLDHVVPHPHGRPGPAKPGDLHETSIDGLHSPCDREHRLKTLGGWTVARLHDRWEWTSPLGKVYVSVGPVYTPRQLHELEIAERLTAEADASAAEAARQAAAAKAAAADEPAPF
jgi:hypothetical protein